MAQGIVKHYKLNKSFEKEIEEVKTTLLGLNDGKLRMTEQEIKAKKALETIIMFLDKLDISKIKDICWIGRHHQIEHSLSDIDLVTEEEQAVGISLKSVRSGSGTQKNLGLETIKKFLSIDIESDLENMWEDIRAELSEKGLEDIAKLPKTKIKNKKRDFPIIIEIGYSHGLPVQKKAIDQSVENFNKLSAKQKSDFLKCIYGIENKKILINAVCLPGNTEVYLNDKYNAIAKGEGLVAIKCSDKSYIIEYNGIQILRVQASFTNGIGISAFCQRAFLINLQE